MRFYLYSILNKRVSTKSFFLFLLPLLSIYANAQKNMQVRWQEMSNNRAGNFYDVQKDFNKWAKKLKKRKETAKKEEDNGYEIYKRWESYMSPRVYPSGDMSLPSTRYSNFITWKQQKNRDLTETSPNSPNTISSTGNWTPLGPIGSPDAPPGYSGSGRINFVRFNPTNSNIMYVGTPDGGLWKSTNGGNSWSTNTDFLTVIGVSDLVISPNNTNIMYLATGDRDYHDKYSIGILKSTDGGLSWHTTGLTFALGNRHIISSLLMDPNNSSIMIAATNDGIYRTTDGWVTYSKTQCCSIIKDMKFKPGHSDTIYAAGDSIWRSIDNGVHWSQIKTGLPNADIQRISLGVSPANANYVYALIGKASDQSFLGLYRSTNGGSSFTLQSSSPNLLGYASDGSDDGGQAFYALSIAISPSNADEIIVGGVNQWKSTDGGVNWDIISLWSGDNGFQFVHADVHEIDYLPGSNTTFFSCNDGGIFKTTDDGDTWTDISNNLSIAQQEKIGLSQTDNTLLVAGHQDNGTNVLFDGVWTTYFGGDGGECFFDFSSNSTLYLCYVYGEMYRIDQQLTQINNGIPWGGANGEEFYCNWHQDPANPNTLYAAGRKDFYVTTNKGNNWSKKGTPSGSGNILDFIVAPSDNSIIYAIKRNAVSKSIDAGATWTNVTGNLPVGSAQLSSLTIADTDPNKLWVTFSGYSSGNKVFKTADGGSTWSNISSGLPNLPINTIVHTDGNANDALYVGSDIGVYYFDNLLASWSPFFTQLPNVAVRDLEIRYSDNKIIAGTFGRGTWQSDLYVSNPQPVSLISFDVQPKGEKDALLKWETASEINVKGYDIEISEDGSNYKKISFVPSKGNASLSTTYEHIATDLQPGVYYFRLKMIDIDGHFTYSSVRVIKIISKNNIVRIYPNPTENGFFTLELSKTSNKKVNVKIITAIGQLISSTDFTNYNSSINLKLPSIPGEYNIQVTVDNGAPIFKKIVLLNK